MLTSPDPAAWDRFAQHHAHGHPLQSSAWGRLKSGFGWSVEHLVLAETPEIVAGTVLLTRRRAGLAACYAPRGPLFSGDASSDQAMLQGLIQHAKARRAVFLRIEPPVLEDASDAGRLHTALLLKRFQPVEPIQPHSTIHLAVQAAPEQLLAAMSKGHRADIRRSAREGVSVRCGRLPSDLARFYAVLNYTATRNKFGIHTQGYYQAVLDSFGEAARLWLAERNGQVEATAMTVGWGQAALYLYSGSTEDGLKTGAQHAIQWAAIQAAHASGCGYYDFWGIPDQYGQAAVEPDPHRRTQLEEQAKSDPLAGVYRFKKGFGGRVVRYLPAYDYVFLPPLYMLWRKLAGN